MIDQTGTLDAAGLAALEAKLAAFEQERGSQVVVLMVATTAPEDIADYTQRLGDAWKIGRKDVGDGVLFVIAKDDRRLRIATAKALEGAIPDLMARRILDQAVTPAFRQGDYAGGIKAGVDQILARIRGEDLPLPGAKANPAVAGDLSWPDLLIFLVFAVPMVAAVLRGIFGNKLGTLLTGVGAGGLAYLLTYGVLDRGGCRPAGHGGRPVHATSAHAERHGAQRARWPVGRRRLWGRRSRRWFWRRRVQLRGRWQFRGRRRLWRLVKGRAPC